MKSEVYSYNVIADQDHDILQQYSIEHIKAYFARKQREEEEKNKQQGFSFDKSIILPKNTVHSINNIGFFVHITLLIIFVIIVWDFTTLK